MARSPAGSRGRGDLNHNTNRGGAGHVADPCPEPAVFSMHLVEHGHRRTNQKEVLDNRAVEATDGQI